MERAPAVGVLVHGVFRGGLAETGEPALLCFAFATLCYPLLCFCYALLCYALLCL